MGSLVKVLNDLFYSYCFTYNSVWNAIYFFVRGVCKKKLARVSEDKMMEPRLYLSILGYTIPQKRQSIKIPMTNCDWIRIFCPDKIYVWSHHLCTIILNSFSNTLRICTSLNGYIFSIYNFIYYIPLSKVYRKKQFKNNKFLRFITQEV